MEVQRIDVLLNLCGLQGKIKTSKIDFYCNLNAPVLSINMRCCVVRTRHYIVLSITRQSSTIVTKLINTEPVFGFQNCSNGSKLFVIFSFHPKNLLNRFLLLNFSFTSINVIALIYKRYVPFCCFGFSR